jgi:TPR repeat protein
MGATFDGHDAKIQLALHLLRDESAVEDKERAVALLRECHFNSTAAGILGWCYKHGFGVAIDIELAVNCLNDAVNYAENKAIFQYELASIYLDESGKFFNRDLGLELMTKSSDAGFQLASDVLASIGKPTAE